MPQQLGNSWGRFRGLGGGGGRGGVPVPIFPIAPLALRLVLRPPGRFKVSVFRPPPSGD